MEYDYCPSVYRLNCKNYEIKCNICKARNINEGKDFYYKPMMSIGEHPYITYTKKSSIEGKYRRNKGRSNEKRLVNKLSGIPNKSSISDDGRIKLSENDYLSLEIKTRLEASNRKWPSKKEWEKAINKGIDVFIVDSKDDTRVCMTLDTFNNLIEYIREG